MKNQTEQTNILLNILLGVGLDLFTAKLYEHLLDDKSSQEYLPSQGLVKMKVNVAKIAQSLFTNRNKIYQSLDILEQNELIQFLDNSKNIFILNSIEVIKAKLIQKEAQTKKLANDFDEYLPDILTKYSSLNSKSYVTKLEGKNNFIYYLNQVTERLEDGGETLAFAESENFYTGGLFYYLFNANE